MLINIKTSEDNKRIVTELTNKLNLSSENYIARIALSYSLAKGQLLNLESDLRDSKGKEYKEEVLFGKYGDFYIAMICQQYSLYKTDKDIPRYIKMHIDVGIEAINRLFELNKNYTSIDFLIENIEKGISALEDVDIGPEAVANFNQRIKKSSYGDLIKIQVGKDLITGEPIFFRTNDLQIHNNAHVAVAGNSGTGKTYFALNFLKQYVKNSDGAVNFIYLDFKGLKKEDEENLRPFFTETNTTYVDAPHTPFPVNPLSFIDNVNEKNKLMGISKFVDIITSYSGIGKNQQQILKDAAKEVFFEKKHGEYPSLKEIYERVLEKVGEKPSTLREILESLSDYDIFQTEVDPLSNFLNKNYYFSLSGDLNKALRFTSVFLVINYIYNTFMNMENAAIEDGIQSMRYVLLIDEAHVIFKDKKSQDLLEKILREIRSKGVAVVLLSQGIEEFNQPSFDFSSMCETAFLFEIKDKTNLKLMAKFMGLGEKDSSRLKISMEKLHRYQIVSNLKEYKIGELFNAN
ncbi:DndE family protein [Mucilaginibacter sp.]|uniref:DndE family protein n=1 Tax=Mucilaginibacter sp. TaxID=1882438 RepID=UPI002846DBBA|nr:DndE family protein [Mucilaginibacter sp.]MDR3697687.1 DndE family protein [Mucilaginibacter sp.]